MLKVTYIGKLAILFFLGLNFSITKTQAQPTWTSDFPKSTSGASTIDFTVRANQNSTVYYVIYKTDPGSLSSATIKSDALTSTSTNIQKKGSFSITANDSSKITASTLPDNKTYYSYLVAESGGILMANNLIKKFISVLQIRQKELSYTSNLALGDGKVHGYTLYFPEEYYRNPTKNYPLLVTLHGTGEKGTLNYNAIRRHGPAKLIQGGREFPFIVATPQIPTSSGSWVKTVVNEFIDKMTSESRVDINRIYLTGFSMGGAGTFTYATSYASKVAAIVPISGWGSSGMCNLTNLAVWAFHNNDDGTVGVAGTNNAINNINACTPKPTIVPKKTIYPSGGHDAWSKTYSGSGGFDIYTWMLQYSKNPPIGPSLPPVVNAGVDKLLTLPTNSTTILGAASDQNGLIVTYSWSKQSGPSATLAGQSTASLVLSNLVQGSYVFRLTATDNSGDVSFDEVTVNVVPSPNVVPVANAGTDKTITLPSNTITINGNGTDANGSISSYLWAKQSGGTATLSNITTQNLTVSNLLAGSYEFKLTVTDNQGATGFDLVSLIVNSAVANISPTVSISAPVQNTQIIQGNNLVINSSANDADGNIAKVEFYNGTTKLGEDLSSPYSLTTFSLAIGSYTIFAKAFDNSGASTLSSGTSITILSSSVCSATGFVLREQWDNNSGNVISPAIFNGLISSIGFVSILEGPVDISNNYSSRLRGYVCAPISGNYIFWISGDDNCDLYLSTDSTISSKTKIAFVNGYTNYREYTKMASQQSIPIYLNAGQKYYIEGTHKEGQGKDNISIGWQLPDGTLQRPILSQFLSPYINILPTITLSSSIQTNAGVSNFDINATALDLDGTIVEYQWSKVGTNNLILSNSNTSTLGVSNLEAGNYTFKLTVKDNSNAITSSDVQLNVLPVSNPVTVNAGSDIYTFSNIQNTIITATSNLAANNISSIQWTQISGTLLSTTGSNTFNLIINPLATGNFGFRVAISNLQNQMAFDTVNLIVASPTSSTLYRVNGGGTTVSDPTLDWANDNSTNSNPQLASDNKGMISGSGSWNYSNTTFAPSAVFKTYRFSTSTTDPLKYSFPVQNGDFEVRLYFAETNATVKSGGYSRVFDIKIENANVLQGLNVFAEAGTAALQKTFFTTVNDGSLDVSFIKNLSSPIINAIEIIGLNGAVATAKTSFLEEENKNLTISTQKVKVYPNPFNDQLTIENDEEEEGSLTLVDVNGRILLNQKIFQGNTIINTENLNLSVGVYFLKIISQKGEQQTIKILKN